MNSLVRFPVREEDERGRKVRVELCALWVDLILRIRAKNLCYFFFKNKQCRTRVDRQSVGYEAKCWKCDWNNKKTFGDISSVWYFAFIQLPIEIFRIQPLTLSFWNQIKKSKEETLLIASRASETKMFCPLKIDSSIISVIDDLIMRHSRQRNINFVILYSIDVHVDPSFTSHYYTF